MTSVRQECGAAGPLVEARVQQAGVRDPPFVLNCQVELWWLPLSLPLYASQERG